MATTPASGALAPDTAQLRSAVIEIDTLASAAFGEIAAVARLALAYLETPDGYRHPELIAQALTSIFDRASGSADSVIFEAEQVGCHTIDQRWLRRLDAQQVSRQLGARHA